MSPAAGYSASVSGTCGGSPSSGTAPFTYTTDPVTKDCTVVATFTPIVVGACGSADGGLFTSAPTTNLCSAGTASVVTGTGPWIWSCTGSNGSAQCSADPQGIPPGSWAVSSSVTGGNGTISCTSPVADGLDSRCVLHPNTGYRLAKLTDNGSDVTGQVAGKVYTLSAVTTNHTVIASFMTPAVIFWRNTSTGENTLWYMNGSTHTGTATLEPLSGAWSMVATADFNNDGQADVLWRNISTGANMVWYMNGATHTGSDDLTSVTDQSWDIVGAADFNNDGTADIVWRNSATGQNVVWYMEGVTRAGVAFLDTVTPDWEMIVGTADLNNDGTPDILWRNILTGANTVWYMHGITYTTAILDIVADRNMEIAGQSNN